jgi:hypothetical protein
MNKERKTIPTVVKRYLDLVDITRKAHEIACKGDYGSLLSIIQERDLVIEEIENGGGVTSIDPTKKKQVETALKTVQRLNDQISKTLVSQMSTNLDAINDASTRSRALGAYGKALGEFRSFDKHR